MLAPGGGGGHVRAAHAGQGVVVSELGCTLSRVGTTSEEQVSKADMIRSNFCAGQSSMQDMVARRGDVLKTAVMEPNVCEQKVELDKACCEDCCVPSSHQQSKSRIHAGACHEIIFFVLQYQLSTPVCIQYNQ